MQEKHLFEYAVIRVVPKVEREEFLNVGVILFCRQQRFLQTSYRLDPQRLQVFSDQLDISIVADYLSAFERICKGSPDGGPIAKLDIASRFRWLTAPRSTIVQTSQVHPGFCSHMQQTLERLYTELVL